MDKAEPRRASYGEECSKKRAAVGTDGECPSEVALTETPSDTRLLGKTCLPRRQGIEDGEVKVAFLCS